MKNSDILSRMILIVVTEISVAYDVKPESSVTYTGTFYLFLKVDIG